MNLCPTRCFREMRKKILTNSTRLERARGLEVLKFKVDLAANFVNGISSITLNEDIYQPACFDRLVEWIKGVGRHGFGKSCCPFGAAIIKLGCRYSGKSITILIP